MASLASLMVEVGADISSFSRNMQQVTSTIQSTGRDLGQVGSRMSSVGSQMALAVSLPLMALGTSAVVIGASFDKQMSKVMAISGATGEEFKSLRKTALELGASTSFSSSEVAMAMEELASAGFNTNQILGATSGVLSLASSAGIGLAEASAITGSAINGFALEAEDASKVADILAKSAAISATDATQLGEAFKYVAPVASTFGLTMEEVASAVGLMADAGIQGSQAGTTLRTGLLRLSSPTKEMTSTMNTLGMSFFDNQGKMKDMNGIFAELEKGTKGLTDEQKAHTLATLFGAESVSGFMAILNQGTDKLAENTETLKNSGGEAKKMADIMNDNLAGAWDEMTGALEALAISISDVVKGDLRNLAEMCTNLVNKFNEMSPAMKKSMVVFGLIVASIAPLLIVVGLVAQGIGALMVVFGAVSAPVLAIVAGIALLVAGLVLAYAKIEPFRNAVNKVFTSIKEVVSKAIGFVASFVKSKLAEIKQFWDENGEQILSAVQNVWGFIAPIIQGALTVALFVVKFVWTAIKGVIDGALKIIMGLVKIFAGLFTGDFSKMWEGVKQLFVGAIQFVWNLMSLTFVKGVLTAVKSLARGAFNGIRSMWETIRLQFMYGKDAVIAFINTLRSRGLSIFNSMGSGLASIARGIWNTLKNVFTSLRNSVTSIFSGIRSVASSVWESIKSAIVRVASAIYTGVSDKFNSIKTRATSIFNAVKTAITRPIESAKSTVLGIIETIKGAFSRMKITIPKPKIPSVSVSMAENSVGIPYPKFSVNWNAKGGIYNGASILGGGQGVGEAGAEAVVPIQHKRYMAPFAGAIADHLEKSMGGSDGGNIVNNFNIQSVVIREEADIERLAEELARKQDQKSRMGGRVTYGN